MQFHAVCLAGNGASLADAHIIAMGAFSSEMNSAITAALARKGLRMAATDQANADALEQLPSSLGAATLTLIRA